MPGEAYCKRCDRSHKRPVGRNCKQTKNKKDGNKFNLTPPVAPATNHDSLPSMAQPANLSDNAEVLAMLHKIAASQNDIIKRVEKLETSHGPISTSSPLKDQSYHSAKSLQQPPSAKVTQPQIIKQYEEEGVIPSLQFLRSADEIQKKVNERIQSLEQPMPGYTGGKTTLKSGRFRTAEAHTQKLIPWPHEFSYTGPMRKTVAYDELEPLQFVIGFCRIVLQERDLVNKESMLKYLSKLCQDALDYSWEAARSANACLLTEMERGTVAWRDEAELDNIRSLYMNKNVITGSVANMPSNSPSQTKKNVCHLYNKGTCKKNQDHVTSGVLYKHICAYCYKVVRKDFIHSEIDCLRKQKQAKD